MALSTGSKLGPYEIVSFIGAGGMGEVYRVHDPRFEREVAIKLLPANFSSDPDRLSRFEQEAKATGALNHPNILSVFDTGRHDGFPFLVTELLEGETLRAKLKGGKLPQRKAIDYALQMARGLAAAHEKGIVHRDLKPENLFITRDGRLKILDFGLAKLTAPATEGKVTQLPTTPGTEPGIVLGTVGYMSPEQVRGKATDDRSDIFSFGAILYEMLTGVKAFHGESTADTMSAILQKNPPEIITSDATISPAVARIVNHCLEKDPESRFQSASDIAFAIESLSEQSQSSTASAKAKQHFRIPVLAWQVSFVIAMAAALMLGYMYFRVSGRPIQKIVTSVTLPDKWFYEFEFGGTPLSPDGRVLAFVADNEGKRMLWLRSLDKSEAERVEGSEGAQYPFWSPDSRFIGFFQAGKLKKMNASGGPAAVICDASDGRGGSWSKDGTIIFAKNPTSAIYEVSSAGGLPTAVTDEAAGLKESHRWPSFLPDAKHFLYLALNGDKPGIYVGSLGSKETKRLIPDVSNASYVDPGYLLFVRGSNLVAQRFDPKRLLLEDEPVFISQQKIGFVPFKGLFAYAASDSGILAFVGFGGNPTIELRWYDRSGKQVGTIGEPGAYYFLGDISSDGNKVSVIRQDLETYLDDVWVLDATRNVATRVTFQPDIYTIPFFSPDGNRLMYGRGRNAPDILVKSSTGAGEEKSLLHSQHTLNADAWSPDGHLILYAQQTLKGNNELWMLPVSGDSKPYLFAQSAFNQGDGTFSPDGKWIAYDSDSSGRFEIYIKPVSGSGEPSQISSNGGNTPHWRKDGSELYFFSPDGTIMAADIKTVPELQFGSPHQIFAPPDPSANCIISPDGQRILCSCPVKGSTYSANPPITLVSNWTAGLK